MTVQASRDESRPACPQVEGREFDPLDPRQAGNPYPWLAAARAAAPVFYLPKYNLWCVTRYNDVLEILKDPATYSSRNVIRFSQLAPEFAGAFPEGRPDRVLVNLDPPEHTRLRRLAQKAFSAKLVAAHEDKVRALVNALIDGFVDRRHCDLVKEFAQFLPVQAITTLVGAPLAKSEYFRQWGLDRLAMLQGAPQLTAEQRVELSARAVSFDAWLREFVEQRRVSPQDDLATSLLQATTEEGDPALTTNEVVSLIATILSAGSSSTAHVIPAIVRELLNHPAQWNEIKADRKLISSAVEEGLRYATSVHGVMRKTNRPVTIAGVQIPQDADIYVHYASAQRDDAMFDQADRFDIHRPRLHQQIAFGRFVHLCLGAPLARMEVRLTLECLIERMPAVRLVEPQRESFVANLLSPGLESLLLEW